MKYIAAIIGLFFWLFFTFLLSLTVIGIVITLCFNEYWKIPIKLLKVFKNN